MLGHTARMQTIALLGLWLGAGATLRAEAPVVVFDVPFSVECRDITPKVGENAYRRKIIEAVLKISPQIHSGEERDVKRLHYEVSTEQQMPVVGFLPNAELASNVAGGTIAIQSSEHHGNLSFRYLILPASGNGELKGNLESSRAQYAMLANKQLLIASGTIDRGCGVYYDLRPSTQDTFQRQREFACLFDVPKGWRADYVTIRCKARGTKRGFAGLTESEVDCGSGLLCVGLYMADDDQAHEYAESLARKQQLYLHKLAMNNQFAQMSQPKFDLKSVDLEEGFPATRHRARQANPNLGAAVAADLDEHKEARAKLPSDACDAGKELDSVKRQLRALNGQ